MTLDQFKSIFWWEWGHRQLGRVIGLVWAVGFLGFLGGEEDPGRLDQAAFGHWRFGWFAGGDRLVDGILGPDGRDGVDVASYRLATHLGLAFIILGLITWYALLLGRSETDLLVARRAGERKLVGLSPG